MLMEFADQSEVHQQIRRYLASWHQRFVRRHSESRQLVTHTFPLEEAISAMELCSDLSKGSIKVHVVDNEDRDIKF